MTERVERGDKVLNRANSFGTLAPLSVLIVKTFLYLVRLDARFHNNASWTSRERELVKEHFLYLQRATEAGQVIMAGRTDEAFDKTFGLVIFEAVDQGAAQAFMAADPAIAMGVMTASLHPYSIAMMRGVPLD